MNVTAPAETGADVGRTVGDRPATLSDKLALLVSISITAAAWLVGDSADEMKYLDLVLLAGAFAIVMAAQCGIVWVADRYLDGKWVNVLVALLAASNVYHFAVITTEASLTVHALVTAAAGALAWVLLTIPARKKLSLLFAAIFTTMSLAQFAYGQAASDEKPADGWKPLSISIKSRRNVYLISMESLHSPHAFRTLHGITELPHVDYLKAEGFRVFDKAYAADNKTRATFQRITEFGKVLRRRRELNAVLTRGNSTFDSFQHSGYGVQFIYINNYLDINPDILDHFYPRLGFYVCDNVSQSFFYIACQKPGQLVNEWLFGVSSRIGFPTQIAHLKERIAVVNTDTKPWLTMSHIAYPWHTRQWHRHDDEVQVKAFRSNVPGMLPQIVQNYRDVVSTIKQQDPDAVIVTFGDHGMWLTRGMKAPDSGGGFTPAEFVEDRYGVMLGVYPAEFCKNRFFEGVSTIFLIKSVIQCLNGEDNPSPQDLQVSRQIYLNGKPVSRPEALIK